jgi:hypothetical protein
MDIERIHAAALAAQIPRKMCKGGGSCSCNKYPQRMNDFHKVVTPAVVLELLEHLTKE